MKTKAFINILFHLLKSKSLIEKQLPLSFSYTRAMWLAKLNAFLKIDSDEYLKYRQAI